MATLTEGMHTGEYVISEANGHLSRDQVTIKAGEKMSAGTVVALHTGGSYVAYNGAGSDGADTAKGVLYAGVDATDAAAPGVIHSRLCEVNGADLTGLDAGAVTDLAATYVIVRNVPSFD